MQGKQAVISALNQVLQAELTASQQYLAGGARFRHMGLLKLATKLEAESKSEFEHARLVAQRVLFLDGVAASTALVEPSVHAQPLAQFEADLALEKAHADRLNAGIKLARENGDHGSADLLEQILISTEDHIDWLETQIDLSNTLGVPLYLAQQL
jgi:bacterioferritin